MIPTVGNIISAAFALGLLISLALSHDKLKGETKELREELREMHEMASEALKRQMPKKPTTESTRYGLVYDCSVCNCGLEPHDGYCSRCGQAIDWSEE